MSFDSLPNYIGKIRTLPIKKNKAFYDYLNLAEKSGSAYLGLLCCPDYSYKIDRNGWCTYDHDHLNDGEGMMAKAYSLAVLQLTKSLLEKDVFVNIILFYGDNEAYDEEILSRLDISKEYFLDQIKLSMARGKILYQNLLNIFFSIDDSYSVSSVSMNEVIYNNKKIGKIANTRMNTISKRVVSETVKTRKDVLISMYGKDLENNSQLLEDKAQLQIYDRIVVGSYFNGSKYISGKNWGLFTLSTPGLKRIIKNEKRNGLTVFEFGTRNNKIN